ncbi:MAG: hypothetical protein H6859_03095 [Rhodospirillales bacterium]|nr:hypothetical protein [Alphaproteobacteria bacterium]USO06196.1 MAG: hypothetical protein H6859_03095 [Rhodospirillales bacterium]
MSDTVGFIADLPTHLIAAFRATLEQTLHADVILHVIDAARPDYQAQRRDVIEILGDLGIEYENDSRIIEVYNKVDQLSDEDRKDFGRDVLRFELHRVLISAVFGQGIDNLLNKVAEVTARQHIEVSYHIPHADGKALSWLYEHAEMLGRNDGAESARCRVRICDADHKKFKIRFGYEEVESSLEDQI